MNDSESEARAAGQAGEEVPVAVAEAEEKCKTTEVQGDTKPLAEDVATTNVEDDKLRNIAEALTTGLAQLQEDDEKEVRGASGTDEDGAPVNAAPPSLASVVKQLILLHVTRGFPAIRNQVIHNVRDQFVGIERIKRLILDGYTPEQIGEVIVPHDQLVSDFKRLAEYIAYLTLGIALTQTIQPLKAVLHSSSLDAAKSLHANVVYLTALPPPTDVIDSLPAINYDPLVDFVEAQKKPGAPLDNDPEWEDLGKKNKQRWDNRLSTSLEALGKKFNAACDADEHVWGAAVEVLRKLVDEAEDEKVYDLVKEIADSKEDLPRIPMGVGDPTHTTPVDLAAHGTLLCSVASTFKTGLQ